jgi:hypothetical protein
MTKLKMRISNLNLFKLQNINAKFINMFQAIKWYNFRKLLSFWLHRKAEWKKNIFDLKFLINQWKISKPNKKIQNMII